MYHACCIVQLSCTPYGLLSLSCLQANKGIYVSYWKVLCDQSSWKYSHVLLWVHKNRFHGPLFIVWVLSWVLFLLWLVWHVDTLPKVIQGPCLVSRNDAYMGTCYKYHVMDAALSLLWWCWNHHLVTHSILLNPKVFYGHRFFCIMLCLCYSSFRYLHGESRYTTDSTRVGVTLDYVVVNNHSLTRTISHCLYFLNCHGALVCLVGSMT